MLIISLSIVHVSIFLCNIIIQFVYFLIHLFLLYYNDKFTIINFVKKFKNNIIITCIAIFYYPSFYIYFDTSKPVFIKMSQDYIEDFHTKT